MSTCELCYEAPASVFTETLALCKPCWRDADRMAVEDNEVPNAPTCPRCGGIVDRHDLCAECFTRNLVGAHAEMGRAS